MTRTHAVLAAVMVASCVSCAKNEVERIRHAPEHAEASADASPVTVVSASPSASVGVSEPEAVPSAPVVVRAALPAHAAASVRAVADAAIVAMAAKDMHALSALVHPKWGVRFTPYTTIDAKADVVLTSTQLDSAMTDRTVRLFGHYDGSGDPIATTFASYWDRFVWDKDYDKEKPTIDGRVVSGLATDNTAAVYPGASVVEWYVTAKPGHLDWGGLRLVFAPDGKQWWLVGVIHDQWVI